MSTQPAPVISSEISLSISTGYQESGAEEKPIEVQLRAELYAYRKKNAKREPLDPTYDFLLLQNSNCKRPLIFKDDMYKKFDADLREKVETYAKRYGTETPMDDARQYKIGRKRDTLDIDKMKAAFTLRECKDFEQKAFINTELAASKARRLDGFMIEEGIRKSRVESMALGLQERERKKTKLRDEKEFDKFKSKILETEKATLESKKALTLDEQEAKILEERLKQKEKESLEAQRLEKEHQARLLESQLAREQERRRELERRRANQEERLRMEREREEHLRKTRSLESPEQALQRIYAPMFQELWEMEFFDGTNPFRLVIDKHNCAAMGVPDYCTLIKKPMNLTYIREKVQGCKYSTLSQFFEDIELIISNCLLYNSDPTNPYNQAANVLKTKYISLRKQVLTNLQQAQS
jgi:hypothetical protein